MCFNTAKPRKDNPWAPYRDAFEAMCAGIAKKPKRIESVVLIVPTDGEESAQDKKPNTP